MAAANTVIWGKHVAVIMCKLDDFGKFESKSAY